MGAATPRGSTSGDPSRPNRHLTVPHQRMSARGRMGGPDGAPRYPKLHTLAARMGPVREGAYTRFPAGRGPLGRAVHTLFLAAKGSHDRGGAGMCAGLRRRMWRQGARTATATMRPKGKSLRGDLRPFLQSAALHLPSSHPPCVGVRQASLSLGLQQSNPLRLPGWSLPAFCLRVIPFMRGSTGPVLSRSILTDTN
jgi:hypothetical protein